MKQHINKAKLAALAIATAVLAACGGGEDSTSTQAPTPTPTPAPAPAPTAGINALLGTVSFVYNFNGSSNVYRDSVTFSTSDLDSSGNLAKLGVSGVPSKAIACSYDSAPVFEGYSYLCIITSSSSLTNSDIFWFKVTNGVLQGRYDYCIGPFADSACVTDIALGADGPVSGTVTTAQTQQSARSYTGQPQQDSQQKIADKSQQRDVERPLAARENQLANQIRQSLEKLSQ